MRLKCGVPVLLSLLLLPVLASAQSMPAPAWGVS